VGAISRQGTALSKKTYIPVRGDVVHLNLGNTGGSREFDGPHYALVISKAEFNKQTGLCVVLPTTSKNHPELGALAVKLPELKGLLKDGWVLLHQVRSVDFRERSTLFAAQLDAGNIEHQRFIDDIVDRLFSIVD
jgi:mRNA interferase MazF